MPAPPQASQREQRQASKQEPKTAYADIGDGAVSGNVTKDPDLRWTPQGQAVTTLRVAETPRVQAEDGSWTDGETSFWDVIIWGDQAQRAIEALRKGDRIAAVGRWQKQTWTDQEDNQRSKTVLVARDVGPSLLFLDARIERGQRRKAGQS